jgi:arylsulfatase A-like enzyme
MKSCRPVTIAIALLLLAGCRHRERRPLNLLLITLDSTRPDHLGCYGAQSGASPAIDKLAASGLRFAQVDSASPLTLPSHATLLTGLLPQRHGLRLDGSGTLRTSIETLASVFARRGFRTAAFVGSSALDHRYGLDRGFAVYDDALPEGSRPAGAVADAALKWLGANAAHPFFAWVHFSDPHAPYSPGKPNASYDGEIAYVDSQVARLAGYLDRAGLRDKTLIVIAGDHGEGLGDHGESTHGLLLYESTLRVPLIITGGSVPKRVVREAIATADVPPTIAALAGAPMNVIRLNGRDLSADLLSAREPAPRDIYAETQAPSAFGWSELRSLRRDGKKLISGAREELFDLDRDSHETVDISGSDRATYRELSAGLAPMRRQTSRQPEVAATKDPRDTTAQLRAYEEAAALLDSGDARAAVAKLQPLVDGDPGNPEFGSALDRASALLAAAGR